MEEHEQVDADYLKGFNEGYTIAQYMPELAAKLEAMKSESIRSQGFKAGREQYQTEQLKNRLPGWLKGDRSTKEQSAPTKDRHKGIEPEK